MGERRRELGVLLLVVLLVVTGCAGTADEPGDVVGSDSSIAAPTSSNPTPDQASSSTETTVPPSTEPPPPDYEAIYRQLHDQAVAFVSDPLTQPSDAMNCAANIDCVVVTNQAIDGQFWQGIGPDNLTITSVEVLDEVSPDLVHLKVSAEAEDVIRLVGTDGEVVEQFTLPTGAAKRVALVRNGDAWTLSSVMDGRSWTRQSFEPRESFDLVDPLDEPMTPTGEEGVTADGVAWRALVTEDRFCLEALKLPIGKVTRCLSRPQYSDLNTTINFRTAFSGDSPDQEYLVLWFGFKTDEGIMTLEDGTVQTDELFPVDTSAVFDDVELSVGVSMIDQRPASVSGRGPEAQSDTITFSWPTPKD